MGTLHTLPPCHICACANTTSYEKNGNANEGTITYFFHEKLIICWFLNQFSFEYIISDHLLK